eukprot:jgi/Chlat1/6657/Chrsp49S06148
MAAMASAATATATAAFAGPAAVARRWSGANPREQGLALGAWHDSAPAFTFFGTRKHRSTLTTRSTTPSCIQANAAPGETASALDRSSLLFDTTEVPTNSSPSDVSVDEIAAMARRAAEAAILACAELEELSLDMDDLSNSELYPSDTDRALLAEAQQIRRRERRQQRAAARSAKAKASSPTAFDAETIEANTMAYGVELAPAHSGRTEEDGDSQVALAEPRMTSSRERRRLARSEAGAASSSLGSAVEDGPTKRSKNRVREPSFREASNDSVRVYLREIGQTRLLTAEEEIELSREIQAWLKLERAREKLEEVLGRTATTEELSASVNLSVAEVEYKLRHGKACKDRMVQANLRLVVSIAKKYVNRGLSFQDLIQEGSMGLIKGAEKFDFSKGFKFSTYAHWWIRQAVTRAIADQSRTIRLPVHLFEIMSRIKKTSKAIADETGRPARDEDVASHLNITVDKLQAIYTASKLPLSLDAPVFTDEKATLEDMIEADVEEPQEKAARELLKEDLENVLNTLNPRERDVLRLRYGLADGRVRTLEEIGNVFKVTRERIRQIEAKALRKLRQPSRNSILREYLET